MSYNIFISYSTKDLEQVNGVKKVLDMHPDIDVFVAENSIQAGEKLTDVIIENIRDCNLFIVLWSKNSKESDWVSQEIGMARAEEKVIIPILLDKDIGIPGFIKELKYYPLFENKKSALETLQSDVYEKVQKHSRKGSLIMLGIVGAVMYLLGKD